VAWVDDAAIRALNRKWLGRDRATDVLSFSMREGQFAEPSGDLLGDIVISLQSALRLARRRKIPTNRVVAHLLVHGLLHLLGHEHVGNARRRAVMRREERRLLKRASSLIPALGVVPLSVAPGSTIGRSRGRGGGGPKKPAAPRSSR
jgi:probable rRNA maturation factor